MSVIEEIIDYLLDEDIINQYDFEFLQITGYYHYSAFDQFDWIDYCIESIETFEEFGGPDPWYDVEEKILNDEMKQKYKKVNVWVTKKRH